MPQLSLVPGRVVESWGDPEIEWYFREAHRLGVPAPTSLAIEAHDRAALVGFGRLWWAFFHEGRIERPLMEAVRVRIAEQSGCAYCATSRLELSGASGPGAIPGAAMDPASPAELAALDFADTLALRPWELGAPHWAGLREAFDEAEVVELAGFAAWQYSGPRMLRSWGAGRYKPGPRSRAADLPVPLPYDDGGGITDARPTPPDPDAGDPGSAPPAWLAFLAPRPELAAAWLALWRAAIDRGLLPPRIPQLVRVDLARRLVHPTWAPIEHSAIRGVGIDRATVEALPELDPARLDDRERAALTYARSMLEDRELAPVEEAALRRSFSEPELVQLGFAVAIQVGAILVDRSRQAGTRPAPITPVRDGDPRIRTATLGG